MNGQLPRFDCCFCCSPVNDHGLHASFHVEDKTIIGRFSPPTEYCGYPGITHGGITATLLDEAMTWAATVFTGTFHFAGEVKVRYRRPVPSDKEIVIRASVIDTNRKVVFTDGQVATPDGVVLAHSEGKYYPVPAEQDAIMKQQMKCQPGGIDLRADAQL